MDKNEIDVERWARIALALLLRRCSERAAHDMEIQAGELLLAARALRGDA